MIPTNIHAEGKTMESWFTKFKKFNESYSMTTDLQTVEISVGASNVVVMPSGHLLIFESVYLYLTEI